MLKRILGILLIIIAGFFMLMVLAAVLAIALGRMKNNPQMNQPASVFTMIFGALVTSAIAWIAMRKGLQLYRKPAQAGIITGQQPPEINQVITVKHEFNNYFKMMLALIFKRTPYLLILPIMGIGFLVVGVSYFFGNPMALTGVPIPQFLMGALMFGSVIATYFQIKKQFNSNPIFQGAIQYHITTSNINIKGEQFESTRAWSTFHQFQEMKDFFMIYESKTIAIPIPKSSFPNEQAITEFRLFLSSIKPLV